LKILIALIALKAAMYENMLRYAFERKIWKVLNVNASFYFVQEGGQTHRNL
jgi:hypothetical protein